MQSKLFFKFIGVLLVLTLVPGIALFAGGQGEDVENEEDRPVLKFLGRDAAGFNPKEDPVAVAIEEVTDYEVEYVALPEGDQGTQKMLVYLAGGEQFDIAKVFPQQFFQAKGANAALELNDLLEKHGENILAGVDEELWNLTKSDGKIYGIPQASPTGGSINESILFRTDVLNELGLSMPKTTDELRNVLKTIEEETELIPLTFSVDNNWVDLGLPLQTVASAFGLWTLYPNTDGEFSTIVGNPRLKDFFEYLHTLYSEDLIDVEFAANKRATKNQKFVSGQAAAIMNQWWEWQNFGAIKESVPEATVAYMPPLKNSQGPTVVGNLGGIEHITFIPSTAAHPVDAIKWIDTYMKADNFRYLYIGEEGVHHTVEDGEYKPIQPAFSERNNTWFYFPALLSEGRGNTMWKARLEKIEDLARSYKELSELSDGYRRNIGTHFIPKGEVYSKNEASLRAFLNEKFVEFVMGGVSDAKYQAFVEKWEQKGGPAVAAELTAAQE